MRSKFLKGEAKQMALAREAQPEYRELVREQGRPPIRRPRADIGRARGAYRPRSNAGVGSGSSSSSESEELSDNIPVGFGGHRGRRGAIQHLRLGAIPPHLMNPAQLNPPGGLRMEYTERYSRRTPMMNSAEATRLMRERNPRLPVVPRAHRTIEEIFEDAKAEKEEKKQAKVEIRNMFLDKQEPLKPGTVEERMAFRARLKGMSLFPNTFNAPMILQGY